MQPDVVQGVVNDDPGDFTTVAATEDGRARKPESITGALVARVEVVDNRLAKKGSVLSADNRLISSVVVFPARPQPGFDAAGLEGGVGPCQSRDFRVVHRRPVVLEHGFGQRFEAKRSPL